MIIRPEKILIVDDAKFMRITIRKILEKLGFEYIYEADSVDEALQIYQLQRPDFVTMDITMPGDSGLEGLRKIKEINPAAKILMVSAVSSKVNIVKAFSFGAVYFLAKPFTSESFTAILSKVFNLEIPGALSGTAGSVAAKKNKPALTLAALNDYIEIGIEEFAVIGRCCKCPTEEEKGRNIEKCNIADNKKDFIPCKFITVSEQQVKIHFENGDFFVTALPESKFITKLNDAILAPNRKYHLMQDDILNLGNIDFTVNITM